MLCGCRCAAVVLTHAGCIQAQAEKVEKKKEKPKNKKKKKKKKRKLRPGEDPYAVPTGDSSDSDDETRCPFRRLYALTCLDISHNEITVLPDLLGRCSRLVEFDASHNRIE